MVTKQEINERLKKVNIKGKPYVEVAQRVQGFWEIYPNGKIETSWLRLDDDQCVCQASVYDGDHLLAQGTAWEVKKGNVNTVSYVENCETSALGRALGNCGIGSVQSIASADEVAHAMGQQAQPVQTDENPGIAKRGMLEAYKRAQAAGITPDVLKAVMADAVPGKTSTEYVLQDFITATAVLNKLVKDTTEGDN